MKKIQQKYKDIGLKLLTVMMVFIVTVMPASALWSAPTKLTHNDAIEGNPLSVPTGAQ